MKLMIKMAVLSSAISFSLMSVSANAGWNGPWDNNSNNSG